MGGVFPSDSVCLWWEQGCKQQLGKVRGVEEKEAQVLGRTGLRDVSSGGLGEGS
jgi:hypothetical protein